jgi:uncharacterized protein YprB with RNaseH-like and TPR domain
LDHIKKSIEHLEEDNPSYFAEQLSNSEHWRLFPDFRDSVAYLDIETTGLGVGHYITTIAIYDGKQIFEYVQGENLDEFKQDIEKYKVLVTYNGKSFDVPFIERYFNIKLTQANIDLRYVLRSLGYSGGLKECERQLGINRKDLADIDGYAAVLLWNEFKRHKNSKALETLLAYNVQDVLNLETLLVMAYNKNIAKTPFGNSHRLSMPVSPKNPFEPDRRTLDKVLGFSR